MNRWPVINSKAVKAIASIAVANWQTSYIGFVPQRPSPKRRRERHVPHPAKKIADFSRFRRRDPTTLFRSPSEGPLEALRVVAA
jgi:hypothetical protein